MPKQTKYIRFWIYQFEVWVSRDLVSKDDRVVTGKMRNVGLTSGGFIRCDWLWPSAGDICCHHGCGPSVHPALSPAGVQGCHIHHNQRNFYSFCAGLKCCHIYHIGRNFYSFCAGLKGLPNTSYEAEFLLNVYCFTGLPHIT